jgi:DNA-binding CsgD family transcriptional regulator/pimeloyl-ACP methyl ester carboxylesterase
MDAPPLRYVRTSDGCTVAYTVTGQGRPVVLLPIPRYNTERLWRGKLSAPWMEGLSQRFRLIQCDVRTQSQHANPPDMSISAQIGDLHAVIRSMNLASAVLIAFMGFSHVALRYAVANPGRVEALVLVCSPVASSAWSGAMFESLPAEDWEVFLQTQIPPGLSLDERSRELDLLRQSTTKPMTIAGVHASRASNVSDILPLVDVPTLVMHPRDFIMLRSDESAQLAASIKNAQMVLIDGVDLLGDHVQGLKAIDDFLARVPQRASEEAEPELGTSRAAAASRSALPGVPRLSARETDVLRLIAAGKSNQQIADELVLSRRTVERHITNLYAKIGAHRKSEAAAYAFHHGIE